MDRGLKIMLKTEFDFVLEKVKCVCGNDLVIYSISEKSVDFICKDRFCREIFYLFKWQITDDLTNSSVCRFGTNKLDRLSYERIIARIEE